MLLKQTTNQKVGFEPSLAEKPHLGLQNPVLLKGYVALHLSYGGDMACE